MFLLSITAFLFVSRPATGCGAGVSGGNDYEIISNPIFDMDIAPPVGWTYFPAPAMPTVVAMLFAGQSNDTTSAKMRADNEIKAAMIEAMLDANMPLTNITNNYQPDQFANPGTTVTADMTYGRLEGGAITGLSRGGTVVPPVFTPFMKKLQVNVRNTQTTRYTWNIVKNNFLQKLALQYNAKLYGDVRILQ